MLMLTRNEGEKLLIYPDRDTDPEMTLAELFKNGPIEILIQKHNHGQTKVGIEAPVSLMIRREEVLERRSWPVSTDESLSF